MLIPELDLSDLEVLSLLDTPTYKSKASNIGTTSSQATGAEQRNHEGNPLLQYSTFNFWRAPNVSLHSVDLDLL
ncbi:AF1q [Sigmodon hispidus]